MPNPLPRSTPAAEGLDPIAISAFLDAIAARPDAELHSMMVLRHGKVVAEGSWKPYPIESRHMLFSLSKSFTSTAVGFAVTEGLLSLDDPVLKFFPEDAPKSPSKNLRAMRVRHLITMSTGHDLDTTGFMIASRDNNWVKGFLRRPVKHAPGTHFLYNTGATYMLSAIVQGLTGSTVLEYLEPRLFQPLGIEGAAWQTCPKGICTGGFGLNIDVESIAKFGQFLLQRGMWEGKQLLPAQWIDEATAKQVENGPADGTTDWGEGYGYQFWRCIPGGFRGDGAFGQYCIVVPQSDMVIAITSGLNDMGYVLASLWKHLLPGAADSIKEKAGSQAILAAKLNSLHYDPPALGSRSALEAELSGKTFAFDKNPLRLRYVRFVFREDGCTLTVAAGGKKADLLCGRGSWQEEPHLSLGLPVDNPLPGGSPVASSFTWESETSLLVTVRNLAAPYVLTLRAVFECGKMELKASLNVNMGPKEFPAMNGKAV